MRLSCHNEYGFHYKLSHSEMSPVRAHKGKLFESVNKTERRTDYFKARARKAIFKIQ